MQEFLFFLISPEKLLFLNKNICVLSLHCLFNVILLRTFYLYEALIRAQSQKFVKVNINFDIKNFLVLKSSLNFTKNCQQIW